MRAHHSFRAMGTDVSLTGPDDASFTRASEAVEAVFAREERRFSRFRDDSELSRVNLAAGRWTSVSAPFAALIGLALTQARRTDGLFDPTVLHAMVAAGYDRDFDDVLAGARGALHPPQPCGRWREIAMRPGEILLPAGVGLDVGGIAKGWTSDLAAEAAVREGLPWSLVSAGGDLRIAGGAPPIDVRIEDPGSASETAATLRLDQGGLASSSTLRRAWGPDLHHILDPRTGAPTDSPIVQSTVWAPTCAEAEVLATWALLTGTASMDTVPCALVSRDGDLIMNFETEAA